MTPCETRSVVSTGGDYSVFGARKMHAMRGRPEIAERHGAGHVARCTVERLMRDMGLHGVRRAKSPRTTRSAPKGAVPGRPGEPSLRRFQAERAVGVGHHICAYFQRLGVRGLRDGRLLPAGHRLADLHEPVRGPGPGRPGNGRLGAPARGRGPDRPGSTTPTAGRGTGPSAAGRPWPSARRSHPSGRRGTPTTTLWPRPSTPCTRPSSSATRAPGRASTMSSSPPPSGSTGTTRCAPTAPSACAPRPSTRPPGSPTPTTRNNHNRPPPEPTNRVSIKPGA